jgi:hypothetical protein
MGTLCGVITLLFSSSIQISHPVQSMMEEEGKVGAKRRKGGKRVFTMATMQ